MKTSTPRNLLMIQPFLRFFQRETSGGIILLVAALAALIAANSPWGELYTRLWHLHATVGIEGFSLSLPLHAWINDGLMAVFFLLVGLEIKRELLVGELSQPRKALLPITAAAGGMLLPGLLYLALNPPGSPFSKGWGIPTVTDIAFSLGVLALLGARVPLALKVFLTALAIADDLGAVLIISLFYSTGLYWASIGLAALLWVVLLMLNRLGMRWLPGYILLGLGLWLAMLHSGIHTSIAGVLLAITIPAGSKIKVEAFCTQSLSLLNQLRRVNGHRGKYAILKEDDHQAGLQNLESLCEAAQAPLQRLEHALHPWVTYGIMPLFAFANAGIPLSVSSLAPSLTHPVAQGIIAGLLLGKPLGIFAFSWLSIRLKWAELPHGVRWSQLFSLSCLGGIGFTVSLFIADLAFRQETLVTAKVGILTASLLSSLLGITLLRMTLPAEGQAESGT